MRILLATLCLTFTVLFAGSWSSAEASDLPRCPEDQKQRFHNCFGTYTPANGTKYVGEWRDDKENGQGTFSWPDGTKYVGQFRDGKAHGHGTFTTAGGDKYVGEYRDGKKHGQGTITFANGNKYVGEFRDGKKNGQGIYTFGLSSQSAGDEYVGEWRDGKTHGRGTYTFASGNKYVGEWRNNLRHGYGTLTAANGDKYVGEFRDGKRHGQGIVTRADGKVEEGIWSDDKFQYARKDPKVEERRKIEREERRRYTDNGTGQTVDLRRFQSLCAELGFTPKTEKFGECVLKLFENSGGASVATQSNSTVSRQNINDQHLELERQRLKQERLYLEQQIAIENARLQAQKQAQAKFEADRRAKREGDALMRLGEMFLKGGASPRESTMKNRTYIIDGHHFNCTFTGNATICN